MLRVAFEDATLTKCNFYRGVLTCDAICTCSLHVHTCTHALTVVKFYSNYTQLFTQCSIDLNPHSHVASPIMTNTSGGKFKVVLHPLLKISMFCALSQNYQHLKKKKYMLLIFGNGCSTLLKFPLFKAFLHQMAYTTLRTQAAVH